MKAAKEQICKRRSALEIAKKASSLLWGVNILGAAYFGTLFFGWPSFLLDAKKNPENLLYMDRAKTSKVEQFILDKLILETNESAAENDEFIKTRKSYSYFLDQLDACRKDPSTFPLRVRNAVQFVDKAKEIEDEKTQLAVINGFANTAILYNDEKAENPSNFIKEYGSWKQRPYDTLVTGKGVCVDYVTLKDALIVAVKGEEWHNKNTSFVGLKLAQNPTAESPFAAEKSQLHIVLIATSQNTNWALDNYNEASTSNDPNYIRINIASRYLGTSEIVDFDKDKLNHSSGDTSVQYQIESIYYPDHSFQALQTIYNYTLMEKLCVFSSSTNPSFCLEKNPEIAEQTASLLNAEKNKLPLTQIKNLSINSNEFVIKGEAPTQPPITPNNKAPLSTPIL